MRDRDTDCPNALHDHPLPIGYVAASDEADERLAAKWSNHKCPDCQQFGWKPPNYRRNHEVSVWS